MCDTAAKPYGRLIPLNQSVGTVLAHDVTEIRAGEFKGAAFKKGHIITETDLPHLARLGKRYLYALEIAPGMMHEDEAALALAKALAGPGITYSPEPSEGKINLVAAHDGLLKVDVKALTQFNLVEGIMCASRHTNSLVQAGQLVSGTRVIPLVIARDVVAKGISIAESVGGIFSVKRLARPETGLVITGSEIYEGLIQDKFVQVLKGKLQSFNCSVVNVVYAPDDVDFIARTIRELILGGIGLIVVTGGLSVDPDDVTRMGVKKAGARELLYGSPVLPGAMALVAEIDSVPILGLPACGVYYKTTVFDLLLPRILAGEKLTRVDLASLSHGGLCLNCEICRFPLCPFGKAT